MISQLPALQVVIPLLCSPLCIIFRNSTGAWLITLFSTWLSFFISILIYLQVEDVKVISYFMGGWAAPWGIEYRIDSLNSIILIIVTFTGSVVTSYGKQSIENEVSKDQLYLYWAAFLLCFSGLLGVTITGDAFNIFVFLEISSLATYIIIAFGKNKLSFYASFQYLIMGTIGATFIVIGIGILYLLTGTLNLNDLTSKLSLLSIDRPQLTALAFLTVGICLKLALFPLHLWLPNAYAFSPSVTTAFLAATATKVAVYLLIRFGFGVFGASEVFTNLNLGEILKILSIAAMFTASVKAIYQSDIKKIFAYSSVAQIGYITLGIGLSSSLGLTASIIHIFNHALTKFGIFLLIGCIAYRIGQPKLHQISGLGKSMPYTSFALLICMLSLIGIPGTAGFISKWYLVEASLNNGSLIIAFLILASSLISIVYCWKIFSSLFFNQSREEIKVKEAPLPMLFFAIFITILCIYFGINANFVIESATQASEIVMGVNKI